MQHSNPITTLLSQYELLTLLCANLSSADIVHLGATSKEHWQYVGRSPVILRGLIAESACDGKGITAQARVFGHWKANPDNAPRKCRVKDARPCSDCGAMVCNMCRFHLRYLKGYSSPCWTKSQKGDYDELMDDEEYELSCAVRDVDIREEDLTREVPCTKTINMLNMKDQTHCLDCEPLYANSDIRWCRCTLHSHFVEPWRCISCILAEETKLVSSQQRFTIDYDRLMPRRWMYDKKMFCKCGKRAAERSTETCRWCGLVSGHYTDRAEHFLRRIYEQLGSSVGRLDRSNDPILSQLG